MEEDFESGAKTETRDRLTDSAIRTIARKGYDAATVQEIAADAGLTTGAIYSRFGSKQALLAAVLSRLRLTELSGLFTDDRPASPVDDLEETGYGLLDMEVSDERLTILECLLAARRDPTLSVAMRERFESRTEQISSAIGGAQSSGELGPDLDPDAIAHLVLTTAIGALVLNSLGVKQPHKEEWERLVHTLFRSVAESDE